MGEISWLILISILHRWVQYLGVDRTDPWGSEMDHPPLGRSYLVVVPSYEVICVDFLNGTLWVSFHDWYWYQSFIGGSNILGVDRTDPWGPEMDHPPLGRSYNIHKRWLEHRKTLGHFRSINTIMTNHHQNLQEYQWITTKLSAVQK